MRWLLLFITVIITGYAAPAKVRDYRTLRASLGLLSCGRADSAAIRSNYHKLLQVDTVVYQRNIDIYWQDLAMACYKMYFVTKDRAYLEKEVSLLKQALAKRPGNATARWNCVFALTLLKRCDEAKTQLEYYLKHTPSRYIDTGQVNSIRARCD